MSDVGVTAGGVFRTRTGGPGPNTRVLVVFESGRCGEAALREAAERAAAGADLSVVTLAPQAKPLKCCGGGGPGPYNCAVREEAHDELRQARSLLGSVAGRASFTALVGCPEPPLAEWAAERSFELILLPAHRLAPRGGRLARRLRRATAAEVRLVS
jgi:Universal stress protein family